MRNVTAGLFSSVDGVVEDPFLWQFDSFDEELGSGSGRRLFNNGDPLTRLELQSSQQTSKGNMILSYGRRQD